MKPLDAWAVMIEDALLAAVLEDPRAALPRLAYADWLEERGDGRAEFLRLECEILKLPPRDGRSGALQTRLHELGRALDPDWVALVRRLPPDPLDELGQVLPPPRRPFSAEGDWSAIESALGLRLPPDYKAFIAAYGRGSIGALEIWRPFHPHFTPQRWLDLAALHHDPTFRDVPYPVFPQEGGLLPFGTLGDTDILNWLTVGEPECWPFVYLDDYEGYIEVKGLSAVEFVLEAVTQRSPLMIRLGSESAFDPPCDFYAHAPDPQFVLLVYQQGADLDSLADRLASRWPAEQVRMRRSPSAFTVLVEPLSGWLNLFQEDEERTWLWVRYDQSCALQAEEVVAEALRAGFTEHGRGSWG